MTQKRISILGVPCDILSKTELKKRLIDIVLYRRRRQIITPNPEFLLLAQNNPEFMTVLREASLAIPDGIGLKFAGWLKGVNLRRYTGATIVKGLLQFATSKELRVAILNRLDGLSSNEEIITALKTHYPRLVVYVQAVNKEQPKPVIDSLQKFKPDLLFTALGMPEQDTIIPNLLKKLPSLRLGMGVGGSFDFITKKLSRAPQIFQIIGMEWLWRLLVQPSRWKRIWKAVVIFPLTVIKWELRRFFYRPNVVAFIINQFNEVLILNARGKGDYWGLPQGGTEMGESITTAVRREVTEETGLRDLKVLAAFNNVYSYTFRKPYTHWGYKGQRQSLCFLWYAGPKNAVRTNPFEHKAYQWVKITDLINKTSPVHKKQYETFLLKYHQIKDSINTSI